MALPAVRVFILLEEVNKLFYSFFVSMGPVLVYLELLLLLIYFFAVVRSNMSEVVCPFERCCSLEFKLLRMPARFFSETLHLLGFHSFKCF